MSRIVVLLLFASACSSHPSSGKRDMSVAVTHDLAAGADDLAAPADLSSTVDATPPPPDLYNPDACSGTCNGMCVALDSDPNNCGGCGHQCGCGSTRCTDGVCDPVVLSPDRSAPFVLAVHGDTVWWGEDTPRTLDQVPTAGGATTTFCMNRTAIRGMDFDANNIYFSRFLFNIIEASSQSSCTGGNYTNTREGGAFGVTHDATNLYWAAYGDGTIRTAAFAAPRTVTTLANAQLDAAQIVVDDNNVYWTINKASGAVMQLAKNATPGTLPTPLATGQASPFGLAVDTNNVYWTNQGDGTINSVPIGGTTITPIVSGESYPYYLVLDGGELYWTDISAGTVSKVSSNGGTSQRLAIHQDGPLGLAVDASCVYFSVYGGGIASKGSIRKAAKN